MKLPAPVREHAGAIRIESRMREGANPYCYARIDMQQRTLQSFVSSASERNPAQRRRSVRAIVRDPALWVWAVVALLALLPLTSVLAG